MKSFLITFFAAIAFILPGSLAATTYYVNPGERIQDAIDVSTNGDTIIVRAGTYTGVGNRDLDFSNGLPAGQTRAITLVSESGADVTIIDCEGTELDPHRGFYFDSGETVASVVDGFTIKNGFVSGWGPDGCGAGIYCDDSSPTITNCTISGNSARIGAGIYCDESDPTITDCTISGNSASGNDSAGGGIFCGESDPTITDCRITGNSAGYYAGGIYCRYSSPAITNCTISDNSAPLDGGGIYCWNNSSPTITNCTISGNSSDNPGGGIYCNYYSSPAITNCTISDNSGEFGGGIFCYSNSNPTMSNCRISGNSAGYNGGAVYCWYNSSPAITNCTISGNSAGYDGGGIFCYDSSSPTIANCTISGNEAGEHGGGIGCYYYGSPTMTDCILWGNTAPNGHEIALKLGPVTSMLTVRYSDVEGGAGEAYIDPGCTLDLDGTCIDQDPLFVKGRYHEFYLSHTAAGQPANSPCIDAGSDTAANLGLDQLTARNDSEYDTGMVDMGYHASPTIWIYSIARTGNDITIRWKARAGTSYTVQWSSDMETWNDVLVGQTDTWTDVGVSETAKFYRVFEQ